MTHPETERAAFLSALPLAIADNATQAPSKSNSELLDSVSACNDVQGIFRSYANEAGVKYSFPGKALSGYITEVERANGIDGNEMGLFGQQDWGTKSEMLKRVLDAQAEEKRFSISPPRIVAGGEVNEEHSRIEREAKANGTWLKAPNGKPSKLNARQWVHVRTEAFKRWFGDWESKYAIDEILEKEATVVAQNEKNKKQERCKSGV